MLKGWYNIGFKNHTFYNLLIELSNSLKVYYRILHLPMQRSWKQSL